MQHSETPVSIPNAISCLRMMLLAPMWLLAVAGAAGWLATCVAISLLSDFLDGFVARRLDQETSLGARLDSLADNLLLVSAPVWMVLYEPGILIAHPHLFFGFVGLLVVVFLVMFVKFGRNVEIHTYASKLGIVVMWTFLLHLLLVGYHELFFLLMMATSYLYLLEDFWLLLTRSEIDEHVKTALPSLFSGRRG